MRTGNEHDRRPRVRVFSTGSAQDPAGRGGHLAGEIALERPEVFWARKAKEDARLRRPIDPRSEARSFGPVRIEFSRQGDNRIVARRMEVAGRVSERHYDYDAARRLCCVRTGRDVLERYEHDRDGRRTVEHNVLRGLAGRVFRYDADGRLASAGDAAFEHDAHGFRCARQENGRRTEYAYTPEGLLRRVALPDGREIGYAYDSQGRRVAKFVDGLVAERYAWKGPRLIGCDNGEVSALVYADGRAPLFLVRAGQTYRLCCDQVGTVFAILDAAGRVVKRIEYDAFGNVLSDSNPGLGLPLGFAGGLADADTGLIRFGARDYDPDTGRFTAQDPLGAAGGDKDLYRYCLADPVNLVDPSGMQFEFWTDSEVPEEEGEQGKEAQEDSPGEGYPSQTTWRGEGRTVFDGPKHGNWCGKNWSGGWNPERHKGEDGPLDPIDSLDDACKNHDLGAGACVQKDVPHGGETHLERCGKENDHRFLRDLQGLPDDPRQWKQPPASGAEFPAYLYKKGATWWYNWFK